MALTFAQVWHTSLGGLKAAVDDWAATAEKLERLAQDARDTLLTHAEQARWEGANAAVSRTFVDKTVREFGDAASAAEGIRRILDDGWATLKAAQDALRDLVENEAPAGHLTVSASGLVSARYPLTDDPQIQLLDPDYAHHLRAQQDEVAAMQGRVDALVERFDDADQTLSRALLANVTDNRHNFSAPLYSSLDQEELAHALELAHRGDGMTTEELGEFNELLDDNRDSPEFMTGLFAGIGAEGTLTLFGSLSLDTMGDGHEVDDDRLAQVRALQQNLGFGLATATDPDNAHHLPASFGDELRRLGTERLPLGPYAVNDPYGYQVLGGILRYGEYDPSFLNPIAEHIVQLHADDPMRFGDARQPGAGPENPFNPSGRNGSGYDPVLGVLEALGHSPEAATQFFSASPTAYNEDGTVDPDGSSGILRGGDSPVSGYLDYFLQQGYEQFPDVNSLDSGDIDASAAHLPDALGHALEAATLGHAWDATATEITRTEEAVGVMEDVVARFAADPGLSYRFSAMTDSLGTMAAGYIDDINWALDGGRPNEGVFGPTWDDVPLHAQFGGDVDRFLSALGKHPDSYATVAQAERVYTASLLEAQVNDDGTVEEGYARNAARVGAQAQGILDQARADQIRVEGAAGDEAYNRALDERASWLKYGAGMAVAGAAALLPPAAAGAVLIPLAVTAGSGAVNEQLGQFIGDWTRTDQLDTSTEAHDAASLVYAAGRENLKDPVEYFLTRHRFSTNDLFTQDLQESVEIGYLRGSNGESELGMLPQAN